jgi:hypothetical protein
MIEHCRTCDELGQHREAHFIVWGRFFPIEHHGPRCSTHVGEQLGWRVVTDVEQYAIFDLRTVAPAVPHLPREDDGT